MKFWENHNEIVVVDWKVRNVNKTNTFENLNGGASTFGSRFA